MDIKNENRFSNIILNHHSYVCFYKPRENDDYMNFYNMFKQYYYFDRDNNILKYKGFWTTPPTYILNLYQNIYSDIPGILETFKDQCLDYETAYKFAEEYDRKIMEEFDAAYER